jgi:hypothetical protein
MRKTTRALVLTVVLAAIPTLLAQAVATSPAVSTCGKNRSGYLVYANGVTCPTAKKLVTTIGRIRYRKPKVTVTGVRGYVCAVTYNRRTRAMKAGSCLRRGTQATGFGWTKGGAAVPLPPGVTPPATVGSS